MKVQILVGDQLIATQIVSLERYSIRPSYSDIKLIALRGALEDNAIRISDALRATFLLYDVAGRVIDEVTSPGGTFVY